MSRRKADAIGEQLNKLALRILEAAMKEDVPLAEMVDVLKVTTAFHIGTLKAKSRAGVEDEDDPMTFDGARERIDQAGRR